MLTSQLVKVALVSFLPGAILTLFFPLWGLSFLASALMGVLDFRMIQLFVSTIGTDSQAAKKGAWASYVSRFAFCAFFLVVCLWLQAKPLGLVFGFGWHKLSILIVYELERRGFDGTRK